ncbi:MAG TPA: NADPH-dependent assimilatory sulfite reductase hemoprotein subunit [Woeseiaceae bacterium]|nr:NADPH-dependent assimilatory sulfite reductase hemoprotein subunit [Woeseiaceae bacterium]
MSGTPSDVERIKAGSRHLRGTLEQSLQDRLTGAIADDDTQLSKFHGIYQQDDRDVRSERRRQRLEPAYSFMIRARVPGGVCTPAQWLAMDELARTHANGTLRLTTRQAFQFHGVIKTRLRATIRGINECLLDTLAACGDVNRNVMAGVNPWRSVLHARVARLADEVSAHLTPATRAYHEIWLDGEKLESEAGRDEQEPIYGATYLPRKFKMGFVVPPENDIDVYSQDLGFIAIEQEGELAGFNVVVGGGMGTTHGEPDTWPRLGDVIGYCTPEQVTAVSEAVVTTQRDFGDRTNRKHARLKYTIEDRGVDWFRGEVERRAGLELAPPRPFRFTTTGDRYGWIEGDDGLWHRTLFIENGRVADRESVTLMTALREVADPGRGRFILTPNQNVTLSGLDDGGRERVSEILRRHGVDGAGAPSALRSHSLACVGLPTCALAMAESERYLPDLVGRLEERLAAHGLDGEPIVIRMTGCPNGCARPFLAEIGLVGKAPGRYNLYLGAGFSGDRLNRLHRENIDEETILSELDGLFARFAAERDSGERFGDFLVRAGVIRAVTSGPDFRADEDKVA